MPIEVGCCGFFRLDQAVNNNRVRRSATRQLQPPTNPPTLPAHPLPRSPHHLHLQLLRAHRVHPTALGTRNDITWRLQLMAAPECGVSLNPVLSVAAEGNCCFMLYVSTEGRTISHPLRKYANSLVTNFKVWVSNYIPPKARTSVNEIDPKCLPQHFYSVWYFWGTIVPRFYLKSNIVCWK